MIGRPSKLNDKLIKAMEEVLSDDLGVLALTDKELLEDINDKLDVKDRLSEDSFERYKAGRTNESDYYVELFCGLYQKAFKEQKKNILKELKNDDKSWQRFAWIMERKFRDNWYIKRFVEQESRVEHRVVSEEGRKKVKDLINSL